MEGDRVEAYLAVAEKAGLLHAVNGLRYVAGRYVDPIGGDTQCLVEYCEPELLSDPAGITALRGKLVEQFPEVSLLRVRVRSPIELPPPWERAVTYVRFAGHAVPMATTEVRVTAAGIEHSVSIEKWLTQAYISGYRSQGRTAHAHAAGARSRQILATQGRKSYVAIVNDVPIGHVTMVDGAADEITGEQYVDLVDMMVEPGPHASVARRALVHAAVEQAHQLSRLLLGTVVHPVGQSAAEDGQNIVERLRSDGWRIDHVDWRHRSDIHVR